MNNSIFEKSNKNLFSALLIVLIVLFSFLTILTWVNISNNLKEGRYIGQEIETKNTISVSGKGEIYAKPDLALVTFSVKNEAKQVSEAMQENAKKMNEVITFLKQKGIAEKDLKTTSFNIYPRYEYQTGEIGIYSHPSGKRVLVGYEVNQSLQVKVRDLTKIGMIIQGAVAKGANQIGSLQFTIDKPDELKAKARELAIKQAKSKAREVASQLGIRLVRVTNFQENSLIPRYYGYERGIANPLPQSKEIPTIETGSSKVESNVTITYEIR